MVDNIYPDFNLILAEEGSSSSLPSSRLRPSPSCQSLDARINSMTFNSEDQVLEEGECVTRIDDTMDQDADFEDSIMNYDEPAN